MIDKQQIEQFMNSPEANEDYDKFQGRALTPINTMAVIPGTNFMSFTCPSCAAWNSLLTDAPIKHVRCMSCKTGFQYIKK